jgi:hypothetical protein
VRDVGNGSRLRVTTMTNRTYERHASDNGWHLERIEIDNKATSGCTKPARVECLWANFEPCRAGRLF